MLEKLLYKIVDFGKKHPSVRYIMLVPLAVVYFLDSFFYYLGLPFRLLKVTLTHKKPLDNEKLEKTVKKPKHKLRNAFLVLLALVLLSFYPLSRYLKIRHNQPMVITAFESLEFEALTLHEGATLEELNLPDAINAVGFGLDPQGVRSGKEKSIHLKISQWNVEPRFEEGGKAGVTYTFTPILPERFTTDLPLPTVERTINNDAIEQEVMNEVYLNGKGNDAYDGKSVLHAVQSFERALELLEGKEGTIWVLNGITIKDEQQWVADQKVTLKRFSGNETIPAYTGAIIDIRPSGSLTMDHIIIDGASITSDAAAILVDGKLEMGEHTQIINNQVENQAGAIDVGSKGSLNYFEIMTFDGCSSDETGNPIKSERGAVLNIITKAE